MPPNPSSSGGALGESTTVKLTLEAKRTLDAKRGRVPGTQFASLAVLLMAALPSDVLQELLIEGLRPSSLMEDLRPMLELRRQRRKSRENGSTAVGP